MILPLKHRTWSEMVGHLEESKSPNSKYSFYSFPTMNCEESVEKGTAWRDLGFSDILGGRGGRKWQEIVFQIKVQSYEKHASKNSKLQHYWDASPDYGPGPRRVGQVGVFRLRPHLLLRAGAVRREDGGGGGGGGGQTGE